jgi:hypothetical protein
MSKHTPGPWEYIKGASCIISTTEWLVKPSEYNEGTKTKVLDLTGSMGGTDTQADARLIAAAPDLLEALEGFLMCQAQDGTKCAPNDEDFDKAREAIAKAKG